MSAIIYTMNDKHIAKLEAQLERMIEGAFAQVFGRKVRAQDIALHLARAMENGLRTASSTDPRPFAPDLYDIRVHSDAARHLLTRQPNLTSILSQHMVELATSAGYRLDNPPVITLSTDNTVAMGHVDVTASHTQSDMNATSNMQRIHLPTATETPNNAQLIIGTRVILLEKHLLNMGRSLDNDIVIEDVHASRHHAQLRLRFGRYTLFDVQSRSGTLINDVQIREQVLYSGDVIQIGTTRIVYLEDEPTETTSEMFPVQPEDTD